MQEEREDEFISLVSYFQVFINNGINVYQSFKSLINYSSTWMSEQISELIEEIDKDKTVQPFINFANKFVSPIVANVMVSIYQMVDQGDSREQLNQFTIFFLQKFYNIFMHYFSATINNFFGFHNIIFTIFIFD